MNLGSAHGEIAIDYTGQKAVGDAMRDLNSLSGAGKSLGDQMSLVGKTLAGAGAVIGAPLVGAAKLAIDFGREMANVNSILQLTDEDIAALGDQVQALSPLVNKGPAELAAGLYDIASSGFDGAEGLEVLENAAYAANAGLTTVEVSGRAISSVLNAYGLEADSAQRVSDVLFKTVDSGVLTFEQLANNMGNTLPLASSLGVSIEELGAAYAQMTLQGVNASAAETQIASLMRAAVNPKEALTEAVQEYGYASAQALIDAEGMPGFLKAIALGADGNKEALFDMLGTQEAMNAALILGADEGNKYVEFLDEMEGATDGVGATQLALAKQMESTGFAIDRAKVAVEAAGVALGEQLEPGIKAAAALIGDLGFAFAQLNPKILQSIALFGSISAGTLLLGGGLIFGVGKVLELSEAFTKAGLSMRKFALGFGLIGAALGLGVLAYTNNWLGFGDAVDSALSRAGTAIKKFGTGFRAAFNRGQEAGLNDIANATQAFGDALLYATGIDITGFTDALASGIQRFGDAMKVASDSGASPLVSLAFALQQAFREMGLDGLADAFRGLEVGLARFGNTFERTAQAAQNAGYSDVAANVLALGAAIQRVTGLPVADFFEEIAGVVQTFGDNFAEATENGLNPFEAAGRATIDTLKEMTGIDLGGFADALGNVGGTIRDVGSAIMDGDFQGASDILMTALQDLSDFALEGIQSAFEGLSAAVQSIDLGAIAINVADWLMGRFEDVKTFIETQTGIDIDAIDLGQIALNIAGWAINALQTIGDAIMSFVAGEGGGATGAQQGQAAGMGSSAVGSGIPIGDIAVEIGGWIVTAATDLAGAVLTFLEGLFPDIDAQAVAAAQAKGLEIGQNVGAALGEAIAGAISSVVAGGGGERDTTLGPLSGGSALAANIDFASMLDGFAAAFFTGFTTAMGAELEEVKGQIIPWLVSEIWSTLGEIAAVELLPSSTAGVSPTGRGQQLGAWLAEQLGIGTVGDFVKAEAADHAAANQAAAKEAIDTGVVQPGEAAVKETQASNPFEAVNDLVGGAATTLNDFWNLVQGRSNEGAGAAEASDAISKAIVDPVEDAGPEVQTGLKAGIAKLGDEVELGPALDDLMATEVDGITLTAFSTGIGERINAAILEGVSGTADSMGGPGTRGESGTASAGIADQIAHQMAESITAAPEEAFAAIGTALMTRVSDSLTTALSTSVPSGTAGTLPTKGGGMGASMVSSIASNLASEISSAPVESFSAIGTALTTRISEAMSTAMAAGARPEGVSETPATDVGASMVAGLATSIASSITAAPIESFAAIGTALQTKISEVLTTAMTTSPSSTMGEGGMTGTGGGTGGGIGAQIATMIATEVQGADFAAVGTALQTAMVQPLQQAFTDIGTTIQTSTNAWIPIVQNAFMSMANTATVNLQTMVNLVAQVFGSLGLAIQASMNASIGFVQNGFMSMANAATTNMAAMESAVTTSIGTMSTAFSTFASEAAAAGTEAGQGFSTGVSAGMDAALGYVQQMVGSITAALQSAADGAHAAGVAVGQGFADGISSMIGTVEAAGRALAAAAQTAINAVQAISSPSKVSTEQGQMVGLGFSQGIDSMIPAVTESGTALGQGASAGIESGVEAMCGAAADMPTEVSSCIDASAGTAMETATGVGTDLAESVGTGITEGQPIAEDAATSLGAGVVDAAATGVADSSETFTSEVSSMMDAGMQTAASELENARALFEKYGMTFGNDLGTAMNETIGAVAGNVNLKNLDGLYDRLRTSVDERTAHLRGLGDRLRENATMTADRMSASSQGQNRPAVFHLRTELDGDVMAEKIIETSIGPMPAAFDLVGSRDGSDL